jgi:hypothetical protein
MGIEMFSHARCNYFVTREILISSEDMPISA